MNLIVYKTIKKTILILLLAFSINAQAQDEKTVTLTVSGQGKTQEEAKQNALRSAIEQAFGTFISSNTEILNDELVKDEIVSVSNGNIQDYEVISEVELPNGGYATTLKATVSITKLTSFVESKGGIVEFKGSLFGANLRQQKLNEESEYKSVINLCKVSDEILSKSLDYDLKVGEPTLSKKIENSYELELIVEATMNENYKLFEENFLSVIRSISMTESEVENYKNLNKLFFKLILTSDINVTKSDRYYSSSNEIDEILYFRNYKTAVAIQNLFIKSNKYLHNFSIKSNLDTISVKLGGLNDKNNFFDDKWSPTNLNIWNLNIRNFERRSDGSVKENSANGNFGFPNISFVRNLIFYPDLYVSSWDRYYNYIYGLKDPSEFFDEYRYFEHDGNFYKINGKLKHNAFYEEGIATIPFNKEYINRAGGITLIGKFGVVGSNKFVYYSRYIATYSESEITKITNFTVTKLE
jgi:hypothetical protein